MKLTPFILVSFILLLNIKEVQAQSNEEMTKASQNPVSNFFNFPFQNNTNYGFGPYEGSIAFYDSYKKYERKK